MGGGKREYDCNVLDVTTGLKRQHLEISSTRFRPGSLKTLYASLSLGMCSKSVSTTSGLSDRSEYSTPRAVHAPGMRPGTRTDK
jgi:hypothetical protein